MELIVGSSGYVGGLVAAELSAQGRPARALARDLARAPDLPGIEPMKADLLQGRGLKRALDGCHTAYFLAHSMERAEDSPDDFAARERRAAERFAKAAATAGLERVVYLGGFAPPDEAERSPHLASRLEVERILMEAVPGSTALRASILVGAGSASFQMLVRLVENLRFLPMPAWHANRTRPIDERDAVAYLVGTPGTPAAAGLSLDIAGPDVMAIRRDDRADRRPDGSRPHEHPPTSLPDAHGQRRCGSHRGPAAGAGPAADGEPGPRAASARRLGGPDLRTDARARSRRAVEHALRDWEAREPLTAR